MNLSRSLFLKCGMFSVSVFIFSMIGACASVSGLSGAVPMVEPQASKIIGNEIELNDVDHKLILNAVNDSMITLGRSISFLKIIKSNDGDFFYIFLIDRVDDNFLVYQLDVERKKFTRKFYYASMGL